MNDKPMPSAAILRKVSRLTDENAHNEARIEIANWLKMQQPKVGGDFAVIFGAIKTAHEADGFLDCHLSQYRAQKTDEMLAAVRYINPAAALSFHKCL